MKSVCVYLYILRVYFFLFFLLYEFGISDVWCRFKFSIVFFSSCNFRTNSVHPKYWFLLIFWTFTHIHFIKFVCLIVFFYTSYYYYNERLKFRTYYLHIYSIQYSYERKKIVQVTKRK